MKPALSTHRLIPAVPGNIQRLKPAADKLHQVLLQGTMTKGIPDLVRASIIILKIHKVAVTFLTHRDLFTMKRQRDIMKVTLNMRWCCR